MTTSDSQLLKIARARDDHNLGLRVAAALTLHAQKVAGQDLSEDSRELTEWILSNPMRPIPRALSFIVADPTVSAKITLDAGAVSSENVGDDDIVAVVENVYDTIATAVHRYGQE